MTRPRRASRRRTASRPRPAARSIPGSWRSSSAGDVRTAPRPTASRKVAGGAPRAARRGERRRASTTTHDPAMVARNGRSTYVVAYFKARSDPQTPDDAKLIERSLLRPARRQAGRRRDRQRAGEHASRQRLGARRAARVPVHLPALADLLPLARRVTAAAAARWTGDRRHVLPPAARLDVHRPVGVRAQPDDRAGARAGDRLQPVHRLALPRGGRPRRLRPRRAAPHAPDRRAHGAVQLGHGRVLGRRTHDLPAAVPVLDGDRRRDRRAAGGDASADGAAGAAGGARPARQRALTQAAAARRRTRRSARPQRRLVPPLAVRHAAGRRRSRSRARRC